VADSAARWLMPASLVLDVRMMPTVADSAALWLMPASLVLDDRVVPVASIDSAESRLIARSVKLKNAVTRARVDSAESHFVPGSLGAEGAVAPLAPGPRSASRGRAEGWLMAFVRLGDAMNGAVLVPERTSIDSAESSNRCGSIGPGVGVLVCAKP